MPQRSSTRPSSSVVGVRPRRDFVALEERRMEAAALFRSGFGPAEVARQPRSFSKRSVLTRELS